MFYDRKREDRLEGLLEQLRLAPAPTSDLFSDIVADACTRLSRMEQSAKAARIRWLSEAGAWTDAALGLVQLELPEWTVRRLIRDDGAWLCSLSRHCEIPIEFDDTAEAVHESLPLAILTAFVEVQRRQVTTSGVATGGPPPRTVPTVTPDTLVCCDNFA
jgi:hypothetical protein